MKYLQRGKYITVLQNLVKKRMVPTFTIQFIDGNILLYSTGSAKRKDCDKAKFLESNIFRLKVEIL